MSETKESKCLASSGLSWDLIVLSQLVTSLESPDVGELLARGRSTSVGLKGSALGGGSCASVLGFLVGGGLDSS